MEDIEITFGPVEDVSENTQDVAAPAEEGVKEQEPAAPVDEVNAGDTGEKDAEPAEQQPSVDQKAINAAAAAARRKAEADYKAEIEELRKKAAKADAAERVAKSQGFESFDDLTEKAYEQALADGATTQVIDSIVDARLESRFADMLANSPYIKQAQEAAARLKEEADKAQINAEIEAFNKSYPDEGIKSLDDFASKPYFNELYEAINAGFPLIKAYRAVNYEALLAKEAAKAKQSTINAVSGKSHLKAVDAGGSGGDEITVPPEVYETYRDMLGWTHKKIVEDYASAQRREKLKE